jgi:hypothetical protein
MNLYFPHKLKCSFIYGVLQRPCLDVVVPVGSSAALLAFISLYPHARNKAVLVCVGFKWSRDYRKERIEIKLHWVGSALIESCCCHAFHRERSATIMVIKGRCMPVTGWRLPEGAQCRCWVRRLRLQCHQRRPPARCTRSHIVFPQGLLWFDSDFCVGNNSGMGYDT